MIALILSLVATCAVAAPHTAAIYNNVLGPSYHAPLQVVPIASQNAIHYSNASPHGGASYTATNVDNLAGNVNQQTEVVKDGFGGHTIRHAAVATNTDPHTGQTDVKHDRHEFHINPYQGQAAVHTDNSEGSLNPVYGQAAFSQKVHAAKIAPGHASVSDVADAAAVSPHSSAASRDVSAARTDVIHDGIAKSSHKSHKSFANTPGLAAEAKEDETNHQTYDGPGYGKLHYDTRARNEAQDALGHAAASASGYQLDQEYDQRVNLGSSNEVQYSQRAAHDPYGNYGAVTETKHSTQGGQLVPQPAVYVTNQGVIKEEPVVYADYQEPEIYSQSVPVVYEKPSSVYNHPVHVAYDNPTEIVYNQPAPVVYEKSGAIVYNQPAPVAYEKSTAVVYDQPRPVAYEKSVYSEPVSYYKQSPLVYEEPSVVYKQYRARPYAPSRYSGDRYYGY